MRVERRSQKEFQMKKIGIIGAGWGGMSSLSTLMDKLPSDEYEIELLEKLDDVGGVWHPSNEYIWLGTHSAAFTIEFPDFPLPSNIDRLKRIPTKVVFDYLKGYVKFKGLDKHMQFNCTITKINYLPNISKTEITYLTKDGKQEKSQYDFVINTNGWINPNIPTFKNQESFKGEIVHNYRANEEYVKKIIQENKKVIILGAGKSSSDMALAFQRFGYNFTWLYRKMYWYFNYSLQDRYLRKNMNAVKRIFFKPLTMISLKLAIVCPEIGYRMLKMLNFLHIPGKPHNDFKKFHHGRIDEQQCEILRNLSGKVEGEIQEFYADGVLLEDGRKINADVVILCTGSSSSEGLIPLEINGEQLDIQNLKRTYRNLIIPEIPNVIFSHYLMFTFGMVNYISIANWVSEYIKNFPSIDQINSQSIKKDKCFFVDGLLDGSTELIAPKVARTMQDFFDYGELDRNEYIKYVASSFFNDKLTPLNFKIEKKK